MTPSTTATAPHPPELADALEAIRARPDNPGPRAPSPGRAAEAVRAAFAAATLPLARNATGRDHVKRFTPARMSRLASWFHTGDDELVVVVPPWQNAASIDEVLAHALAWQQNGELIIVAHEEDVHGLQARLAWIRTPHRVFGYDADLAPVAVRPRTREEVRRERATLSPIDWNEHRLQQHHQQWVAALLEHPVLHGTDVVRRSGYVSWHHHGLQILRLRSGQRSLRVAAGVQYSKLPPSTDNRPPQLNEAIATIMGEQMLQAVVDVITYDRLHGSQTVQTAEHRLQASILRNPPDSLGLTNMRQEFAASRGPGRPGSIDFLGVDSRGDLHVVETKIGHDPKVMLQALDYAIWVEANESSIRQHLCLKDPRPGSRVHIDLVLAAKANAPAVNKYLPGQLAALLPDIPWRLFVVTDPAADQVDLVLVDPVELSGPPARNARAAGTTQTNTRPSNPRRVPRQRTGRYQEAERRRAITWKTDSPAVPVSAKAPGVYGRRSGAPAHDFCLPPQHAVHNLLPEVRAVALEAFKKRRVTWHQGVDGGPGNHLLSSQVQCVNALGQGMADPARLKAAFGDRLDIAEVLPIEGEHLLTFEFTGPIDFFGEWSGERPTPGAYCTSTDAAFRYRTSAGKVELALVEWKYTERYGSSAGPPTRKAMVLQARYGPAVTDPQGPIVGGVLDFDDLVVEPFYQLTRQQLLAHSLERSRVLDADVVRVVHVSPSANRAYQTSLPRPRHRALGSTVDEVWQQLLRWPDRFVSMDSSVFLDSRVTSDEYVRRYGGKP